MTVEVTPRGQNFQPAEMGVNTDWQDMYTAYVPPGMGSCTS